MRRALRWSGWVLLLILVTVVLGLLWYRQAVQPAISGEQRIAGLKGPVDIVRDAEGVPHIYAQHEEDAQFALGYVHAQDRLWQMEMHRRIAAGRLSEVLGPGGLETDRFLRTLGIRRSAEASMDNLDGETRAGLDAYARGVNAWLAARTSPLPPEFLLTGAPAPEPWSPIDSVGWSLMMAWDLGGNWGSELMRMRLAQKGLSMKQINEILPPYRDQAPPVTADFTGLYKQLVAQTDALTVAWNAVPGFVEGMGSNNWVVAGSRSETGKPLLANDPHLGLAAPALWYFAQLSAPGLNVIGATLPGVPSVVLGHNDRIAWGFTNTGPDVQDLFIEKLDAADPGRYQTPDGWAQFKVAEERIKVKRADDVVLKVRISRHGPIVSDGASEGATRAAPKGYAIAFQWTALAPDNLTPQSSARINRARNWDDFLAAARFFHAPQQNMVYADVDGNIGYIAPGKVPVRKPENDLKGQFPAPGWDAKYDWAGFIPFQELPRQFNPADGYRLTANEKIVGDDYPHHITYEWAVPYRADRIRQMILAQPKHSMDSFAKMHADVKSLATLEMLPLLLKSPPADDTAKKAAELLRAWDGTMAADRAEPLIYTAWMRELARQVYADELGPELFALYWDQRHVFLHNVLADKDGQGRWCDDVSTPQVETCGEIVARSLTIALADLARRYGNDWAQWKWGEAHMARSEHRPFARVSPLDKLFDVRVQSPGDTYTVDVGRHTIRNEAEPFVNRHAASLRARYDLSNLENSLFIHSTGQSGIPFSPLYRSFSQRWAEVRSIPMQLDRKAAEQGSMGTLKLTPG